MICDDLASVINKILEKICTHFFNAIRDFAQNRVIKKDFEACQERPVLDKNGLFALFIKYLNP